MKSEQKICLECGFCCDGTLFLHASLNKGERGNLPYKIEQQFFSEGDKDYFRLPCLYFSGNCSIYKNKRADICSSFRCQLLIDYSGKNISLNEAINIISQARALRDKIFAEFSHLSGINRVICFKNLIKELIKHIESGTIDEKQTVIKLYEMLLGKCNVLEALLVKHMRSKGEFIDLMADRNDQVILSEQSYLDELK